MFQWFKSWIKPSMPRPKPKASYFGHKLTIIRKIKDKKGFNNSELYLDGEKIAESMHDLFGDGERIVLDYDLLYEAEDYPLLPEFVLNHSNYEALRVALIRKQIKSFTVEILERYIINLSK